MWGQPPSAVRRAKLDSPPPPLTLSSRPELRLRKEGEAEWRDPLSWEQTTKQARFKPRITARNATVEERRFSAA
jgi:hypothetical protein